MAFVDALNVLNREDLLNHAAFLEGTSLIPSLYSELRWHISRGIRKIKQTIRGENGGKGPPDLTGEFSFIASRIEKTKRSLSSLSDTELKAKIISRIGALSELSGKDRHKPSRVSFAAVKKAAARKRIDIVLASQEDVERRIFIHHVLDNMSELQRYSLFTEADSSAKLSALLVHAMGSLTSADSSQLRWAEEMASKALSKLAGSGIVLGMAALLTTTTLVIIYAAVAAVLKMGCGMSLPAIVIGMIFVINRRFQEDLLAFEIASLHANLKMSEIIQVHENADDKNKEPEIAEDVTLLKKHIGELQSAINDMRVESENSLVSEERGLERINLIVLGEGHVGSRKLSGIASEKGLDPDNIEYIDYEKLAHFNVERLRWSKYDGMIIGEVPHSAKGVATSNMIEFLQEEGFPPSEVCRDAGGEVKITKTSFHLALDKLLKKIMVH